MATNRPPTKLNVSVAWVGSPTAPPQADGSATAPPQADGSATAPPQADSSATASPIRSTASSTSAASTSKCVVNRVV